MAGRIWIPPYKPLGISTQAVPGGGYIKVDPSVAQFGGSVLGSLGRQVAEGAAGVAGAVAEHPAGDNEAVVKAADVRLGEAEQMLLFDPQKGYLNTQGQAALTHAPAVLEAFSRAQDRELAETADDDQRQMLQGLNERQLADFTTQVERHTAAERQRWYDEAGERRIAQMQVDARLHWSDDVLLRRALGTTRAEVREKAERKGWDAPLTEAALRQHTSRILAAAIEGAVERDPDRAQAVRTRYDQHIEAADRAVLDALLTEAQTRRRIEVASTEILNASPPDGEQPTPQWRLRQAEAIADHAVRTATIRHLTSAAAADEARARALAEPVLSRVLKDGLTDPSQIPVREWVTLDTERRQAIETRLHHNAAGTEPAQNPHLVDELATEMTRAPYTFVRRDLIPVVAHLPLAQWQRFRDWQAGVRRNDPATEDELYAIKRGLQLATKLLPANTPDDNAAKDRAELVEEIDAWRRIHGKSPDDADIASMFGRHVVPLKHVPTPADAAPRPQPGIHQIQDTTTYSPNAEAARRLMELTIILRLDQAIREALSKGVLDDSDAYAAALELTRVPAGQYPHRINPNSQTVYRDSRSGRYYVRNPHGKGFWVEFDENGKVIGTTGIGLQPLPRNAQPADLDKIWQNPPLVPPVMPPAVLPGRPIDEDQGVITEVSPNPGVRKPEILPGPSTDVQPGTSILTTPIPDIEIPAIHEYEDWQHHPDGSRYTDEQFDEFQKGKLVYTDEDTGHPKGNVVPKEYKGQANERKTPIPPDAKEVYEKNSLRLDKKTWIGRNEHGVYYKYQSNNSGEVHFQGYLTKPEIQQRMKTAGKVTLKKLDPMLKPGP